ncbi:MAG: hypothetical protein HGA85_04920, partial [Nanoarchaeota archaeon]|nr:hypothetical protein [Nanoarchaeota archaeon]
MSDKPEISISESSNVIANSNINVGGDFIGPGGQKVTINPSWSPAVVESATKEIYTRLSPILKRRAIDEERSRDEIKALAEDVSAEGSFLAFAESHARAEVFYWAARLYASQPENAQDYLYTCLKVDHHFDVSIANSLILDNKGDTDGALQILRDIDNAEAHSTLFSILTRRRGRDLALSWLDSQIEHNDPGFMTGLGWFNVAVALSQEDNWEGSAEILARVNESAEEWPDLAFLEGIVNVALMLPVAHRAGVLRMALFHSSIRPTWGTQTETHRHHAAKCFQRAERLMKEIDVPERIQAGNIWQLWLRLTDPDPVVAEAALKEVQDGMNDIRKAVELVPFTRTFEIPFNPDPLRRYLEDRRVTGGLNGREIIADVLLKKSLLSPRDFAKLLEQEEERFAEVVSRSTIAGWLIEALVADTQIEKARHTLEKRRTDLSDDYNRLEAKILKHEGKDPRQKLEEIYHQSNRLIDLKNLIGYLGTAEDWTALRPLSEKLFQLDPTPDSAKQLIQCLFNFPNGAASVIAFFDEHQEVVNWGADLLSKKAWALFDSGRLAEALVINDRLLSERFSADDLHLDLNIALQSGNWERFPLIVDKAWDRREDHDPNTLLRLATIAAEADVTAQRAMDFAKLAVENDPDSAGTLLQAYGLALHLGREGDVEADWLARAIQLSPPEGPVRQVDIRTVVEKIIPAHRERIDHVENSIHKGEIPLHGAASILNLPLSAFLIDLPKINAEQQDGRKIVIIPIVSGQRSPVEVQKDWTIGLDITSIMVLCYIDLLPEALSAFNKVVLAPDTMMLLLEERRHVRFQQPSRAKDAEEINSQIDRGLLRIEQSEVKPPEWLENEVGHDLAELLETARKLSGRVILPSSINRIGTYIEGKADLREYQEIVLPIRAFIRLLNEKGYIDPALYKRSDDYLAIIDHAEAEAAPSNSLDGPLYLDSLSLTYLQYAGILQAVCISGLDMRVHHTIRQEMASLINAAQEGERRADILDKIRVTLRNALNEGQVIFLPRKASSENNEHISTLAQFMEGLDVIDAICVDDRLSNSFTLWTDKENSRSVPTLCVLDVLNYLEKVGKINSTKRYLSILNLRKSGFALLPIDSKELRSIVNTGRPTKEGGLIESTGMKSLRQTLNRIGSLKVVQTPKEARFLVELQRACFQVIHQIWDDGGMEVEKAVILSLWLWRDIIVFLACTWAERQISEPQMSHSDMLSHLISLLLLWNPSARDDRYKKYLDWVDQDVLNPLLIANARVVASVAQSIKASIETYSGTLGTAEANLLAAHLFKWSPLVIRKRLLRDESFTGQFGLSKKILTINETIFVETNSLIASARKVLDGEGEQRLVSQNGLEIRLFINDEVIQLSYLNESCDLMEIPL